MRSRFALRLLTIVLLTIFFFNEWQKASISAATEDEGMIAFCSEVDNPHAIYIMRPFQYAERQPVFKESDTVNCDPDWSPDGQQLVFIRHAVRADHTRIAIGNIKDGRIRYLTTDDVGANFPSWSPDGKMIAFCGHSEGDEGWQLKVMNVDGSHRRNLAPLGDCEGASWSPDSRQLVFVAAGDKAAQIGVINIDGTGLHFLTDKSGENSNLSPAWSPDGKYIAFRSLDVAPDANDLFIMDADGHNPHAFASGRSPSWSPDSKRLIYETGSRTEISLEISNANGTNKLWITGQEIGNTESIIPPTPFRGPKWSRAKTPQVQ